MTELVTADISRLWEGRLLKIIIELMVALNPQQLIMTESRTGKPARVQVSTIITMVNGCNLRGLIERS